MNRHHARAVGLLANKPLQAAILTPAPEVAALLLLQAKVFLSFDSVVKSFKSFMMWLAAMVGAAVAVLMLLKK